MRPAVAKAVAKKAARVAPAPSGAFGALHPAAARWIGALIRMTAPHAALTAILDVVERLQEALRERLADLGPATVWMGNRILRDAGQPFELVLAEDWQRLPADERARAVELPDDAIAALAGHDWPGNFRELEAVLERALLLHRTGRRLDAAALTRARAG